MAKDSSMDGHPYRFGKDGSKQYEGVPYRFGKDGKKQYRPDVLKGLQSKSKPKKGVLPGRGPNAGKGKPLVVDDDFINKHKKGQHTGPDNTPKGRIPLG